MKKFCKKTFSERRNIVNSIPSGIYCYEITKFYEDGEVDYYICPYWKSLGRQKAKCTLYGFKDTYRQSLMLVWDQVKNCNIKRDYGKEI